MLKQGRVLPALDMKIVDGDGRELPWDGKQFGDLLVRGPWVCSGYFGDATRQRVRRRRLVRAPATSRPSIPTAPWRSPTARRT